MPLTDNEEYLIDPAPTAEQDVEDDSNGGACNLPFKHRTESQWDLEGSTTVF